MIKMVVLRGLLFAAIWLVLSKGSADGLLLGGIAVLISTWLSFKLIPLGNLSFSLIGLGKFIIFFIWHSLKGGWQVSLMALRGKTALAPAMIELPISLPAGWPRLLLMNTIGLMPGTVSYDVDDQLVRMHVLDERQDVAAELKAIEQSIAAIFGAKI